MRAMPAHFTVQKDCFMLDKFDYAEPSCPLCGGGDFYYPKNDAPDGRIPIDRIISRIDALFDKNDCNEAGRVLLYWRGEAVALRDKRGELAMEDELIGYYRKCSDKENCLKSVRRALALTDELGQSEMASGATVFINAATAYKAFGMAEAALPLYERAELICKKTLNPGDVRFGGLYNNMALALADLERFDEAEEAYMSALELMSKAEHGEAEAAITCVNLAHLYEKSGNEEKIHASMKKAYELLHTESLPRNGYYAFVLEKCAPSFRYFGDIGAYEEFKREYERIYAGA